MPYRQCKDNVIFLACYELGLNKSSIVRKVQIRQPFQVSVKHNSSAYLKNAEDRKLPEKIYLYAKFDA